jgi:hypothetical protein
VCQVRVWAGKSLPKSAPGPLTGYSVVSS